MKPQEKHISKLLQHSGRGKLFMALLVLFTGTTLLLLSIMVWANFTELLSGKRPENEDRNSYVIIGKAITERNMASANIFTTAEMQEITQAPGVQDVGAITPALFPVYATIGGRLAMATDLPVASVPDRFIDRLPGNWKWQPGDRSLPVILSSQFLDIYNYVFAPGQGLPQLSRSSVSAVALRLQAGGERGITLSGYVAGFSDRLNTLIVPQSFINFGNATYAGSAATQPSQLILKVTDPSDKAFIAYLDQHGYTTDPQSLRWSRIRTIADGVASALGLLAVIIMAISIMALVLFTELTIVRSQSALTLLRQLGYTARQLRHMVTRRFLPLAAMAMLAALVLCSVLQLSASFWVKNSGLHLPAMLSWHSLAAFLCSMAIMWLVVSAAVRRSVA